jgi:hypothetical protein
MALSGRTPEIPLPSSKTMRPSTERDPLIKVPDLDPQPAFVTAFHVGGDHPARATASPV